MPCQKQTEMRCGQRDAVYTLISRHLLITYCVSSPYNARSHGGRTENNHPCPKGTRACWRSRTVESKVVRLQGREHR